MTVLPWCQNRGNVRNIKPVQFCKGFKFCTSPQLQLLFEWPFSGVKSLCAAKLKCSVQPVVFMHQWFLSKWRLNLNTINDTVFQRKIIEQENGQVIYNSYFLYSFILSFVLVCMMALTRGVTIYAKVHMRTHLKRNNCKLGNFREDFVLAKFRENKTLAKWQNHSVVYWYSLILT